MQPGENSRYNPGMADRTLTATVELDTSDAIAKLAEIEAAGKRAAATLANVKAAPIAAGDKITVTSGSITSTGVVVGVIYTASGFTVHAVHESALPDTAA